jgi:hypothetical protein
MSKIWVYNLIFIPYVVVVIDIEPIRERFSAVAPFLDERGRRLVAAPRRLLRVMVALPR